VSELTTQNFAKLSIIMLTLLSMLLSAIIILVLGVGSINSGIQVIGTV
jgi:hypothetical protein